MLEKIAYYVIGVLGIRLVASYFFPGINSETIDIAFSVLTLLAFSIPIVLKKFFKD
jgi:hypothetical protein